MKKYLIIMLISLSFNASARWADISSASTKFDIYNTAINVNEDGSSESLIEQQFEILKDSARDDAAQYILTYNADFEKIEIIEAKTIAQNTEYLVNKKFIEDKPLASMGEGFDQTNQILIAFPKPEIGSKIYIKFKYISKRAPLEAFYNNIEIYGLGKIIAKANLKIHSKIPLYLLVNDPGNILDIRTDQKDAFHDLELNLKKPIFNDIIEEPYNAIMPYKALTWVSISSMNKWNDLSVSLAKNNFSKTYSQELPPEFIKIMEEAQKEKDEIAQLNIITSMLNDKIQYMMDNRTIEGRLMPRDLDQIAKSQLGDCKDMSASLVAILTKMGFKAEFSAVRRGEKDYDMDPLPSIFAFNHVIVRVTGKDGAIYWIDPTNSQSMAGRIFPDIANKPTLVLSVENPLYTNIPDIDFNTSTISISKEYRVLDNDVISESGSILVKNEEAYPLVGATLYTSKEVVESAILSHISSASLDKSNQASITIDDLSSRIVKDINIKYSFQLPNKLFKTNQGLGLKLNYDKLDIQNFLKINSDTVSDIYLGIPNTSFKQTKIYKVKIKNPENLNFNLDTKWMSLSRKLTYKDSNLLIDEKIVVKKSIIINDELKSEEFKNLKNSIISNYRDVSVIIN